MGWLRRRTKAGGQDWGTGLVGFKLRSFGDLGEARNDKNKK